MITIKHIHVEETFPLRIAVLRNGMAKDFHFVGDNDMNTFHLGAFKNDEVIGIVTCMKSEHSFFDEKNVYQLRGMAVKSEFQKSGVGEFLLEKVNRILNERNCSLVWCNARVSAMGFYKKNGFTIIGDRFNIPKVGHHFLMYKKLS